MPPEAPREAQYMAQAVALARQAQGLASPNPLVGAVLVNKNKIVGQAFHAYDNLKHAEVLALEQAGDAARGATAYVNLEPCCHTGRTSPCTRALIAAGVREVVAGMADPNPVVAGRGFRELREAGIAVHCCDLHPAKSTRTGLQRGESSLREFAAESQRLNEAFAMWVVAHRPLVTLKSAMTLDGSLVPPRAPNGKRARWITSAESRAEVHRMRHASDALLTGIGTVIADDPLLTDRSGLPRRRRLLRVVLDSQLRLSPRSQLAKTAHHDVLVFTCANDASRRARELRRAGIEIIRVPARNSRPDLRAVLAELGRRDILGVLLEAGPTLNHAALNAGLVDKVRLFYAPRFAGAADLSSQNLSSQKLSSAKLARRSRSATKTHNPTTAPRLPDVFDIRIERFGPDFAVEGYLRDIYSR